MRVSVEKGSPESPTSIVITTGSQRFRIEESAMGGLDIWRTDKGPVMSFENGDGNSVEVVASVLRS